MAAANECCPIGGDEHDRGSGVEKKLFSYICVLFVGEVYGRIGVGEQSLHLWAFEQLRIGSRNIAVAADSQHFETLVVVFMVYVGEVRVGLEYTAAYPVVEEQKIFTAVVRQRNRISVFIGECKIFRFIPV